VRRQCSISMIHTHHNYLFLPVDEDAREDKEVEQLLVTPLSSQNVASFIPTLNREENVT
jgi:hypothetical protein